MRLKRYLVIDDPNSGFTEINNVGLFLAESEQKASEYARKQWGTTASLYCVELEDCKDGWSYFT